MIKNGLKLLILFSSVLLISCSEKSKRTSGRVHYSLGVNLEGTSYSLAVDSLFGETIALKGNSTKLEARSLLTSGKYFYFFSRPDKKFYKYELKADGSIEQKATLDVAKYVVDHAYSQNLIDDQTILVMDPVQWGEPEVKWFTISIPDLVIKGSGTYQLPALMQSTGVRWKSNIGRGMLHAGKFIMGTVYYDFSGNFAPGAHAVAFDFPGMTNPQRISTNLTTAELGIFSHNGLITTENGDLYIAAFRGAILGAVTTNGTYGSILRMKAGERKFDESYFFDLTHTIGTPTNIMQLDYLGGNSAMAVLFDDTKVKGWEDFGNDHYFFAKIDLKSKKILKYAIPNSDGRVTKIPLIEKDKYVTFLKSAANHTTHLLEIDLNGGANAFRKGALVEGKDLRGYSIIKHPAQ